MRLERPSSLQRALDRSLYDRERKQCSYTSIGLAVSTTEQWLWSKKSPTTLVSFFLKEQIFKVVQPCIVYLDGQWDLFVEKSRDVLSFDLSTYRSTQWCALDSATDCPKRIAEAGLESNLYFPINGRLFYPKITCSSFQVIQTTTPKSNLDEILDSTALRAPNLWSVNASLIFRNGKNDLFSTMLHSERSGYSFNLSHSGSLYLLYLSLFCPRLNSKRCSLLMLVLSHSDTHHPSGVYGRVRVSRKEWSVPQLTGVYGMVRVSSNLDCTLLSPRSHLP